ncbi:hypothetical protein ABW19_dt0206390 [Dactylella cylindrospora]|nr:hypothetical protein ABW19_dt0206390 [Dactylella cylindrospora]
MDGNGQNNHTGMAIENQVSVGQLSSASPASTTASNSLNMNHATLNGTHFDSLNSPSRRPSYEDDDTDPARPRKRPATLATVELLSAECMSADRNGPIQDANMSSDSQSAQTDTSSEATLPGDTVDQTMSTEAEPTKSIENETTGDLEAQGNMKSDDTVISQDSDDSSQNLGDSDGADEESYRNNNYVISNEEKPSIVPVLESDSAPNQKSESPPIRLTLLQDLRPTTYNENEGRMFFYNLCVSIGGGGTPTQLSE